jgi:hypothetical protein
MKLKGVYVINVKSDLKKLAFLSSMAECLLTSCEKLPPLVMR